MIGYGDSGTLCVHIALGALERAAEQ